MTGFGRACETRPRPRGRCDASGSDLLATPYVGGSLEIMTPGLGFVPGRPRFFVHGDASVSFGFTRDVAKDGAVDAISTIVRMIEMGVEPHLVASSLEGVSAQRLVRRENSASLFEGLYRTWSIFVPASAPGEHLLIRV